MKTGYQVNQEALNLCLRNKFHLVCDIEGKLKSFTSKLISQKADEQSLHSKQREKPRPEQNSFFLVHPFSIKESPLWLKPIRTLIYTSIQVKAKSRGEEYQKCHFSQFLLLHSATIYT